LQAPNLQGGNQVVASAGFDDTNKNTFMSDIKNYFTKSVRPNGPQGITNQGIQGLPEKD